MKKKIFIGVLLLLFAGCLLNSGCHSRKPDNASEAQEQAAELTPKDWFDKAAAPSEKGDYEAAIDAYDEVLELDPLYTSAYYFRGHMWEEKGDLDNAIEDYTKVIEINPNLEKAYLDRATAWGRKGEYDKAIEDLNKALELNPNQSMVYDTRGNAWQMKGEYDKAIDDYVKALELNPNLFVPYNNLAWLLATCSDARYRSGEKAVELALKAAELNPDITTMDTLAAAYAEAGNFEKAVSTMKSIIDLLNQQGRTELLEIYNTHLESYKAGKPWRVER
jgi:tetratricopeptide (TPR) repeat protein